MRDVPDFEKNETAAGSMQVWSAGFWKINYPTFFSSMGTGNKKFPGASPPEPLLTSSLRKEVPENIRSTSFMGESKKDSWQVLSRDSIFIGLASYAKILIGTLTDECIWNIKLSFRTWCNICYLNVVISKWTPQPPHLQNRFFYDPVMIMTWYLGWGDFRAWQKFSKFLVNKNGVD